MAFRFRLDEDVAAGVRRIAQEQLERAETRLRADSVPPEAVHDVRKCLKRLRALLRLVRSGLDEDVYRAENARYRDIGRMLAGARDRHVMLQTLIAIEARHGLDPDVSATVRDRLGLTAADKSNGASAPAVDLADAAKRIAQGRRALRRLVFRPTGPEMLWVGLEVGLKSSGKAFQSAYSSGADEAFHEWRKTVQHHWRHMLLLSRAWPALMTARAHQARDLSQLIGEDHDLGVLAARIEAESNLERRAAREVARLCRSRQQAIRGHVRPLGERLLADTPKGLARRVASYWMAARQAEQSALAPADEREVPAVRQSAAPVRKKPGRWSSGVPSKALAG